MSDAAPKKRRRSPEHGFQSWVDRLIDRIVLPPMFTTAIDPAGTDMARIGRRMSLIGRGLKPGMPDVFVCQTAGMFPDVRRTSAWIELKRGSAVSGQQVVVQSAMKRAGQNVFVCDQMAGVVRVLRLVGFSLHQNADALAAEYEARCIAAESAPAAPRKPAKPRAARPTSAQVKAGHRTNAIRLAP